MTVPAQPPVFFPAPSQSQRGARQSNATIWMIIGAAVVLVFLGIVAVLAIAYVGFISANKNSTVAKQGDSQTKSSSNSTPVPTPKATPKSTPTPAPQLDISGTWGGVFDSEASTLSINENVDNSFTGTITSKTFQVAIAGRVEPDTRKIDFKETKVLRYNGTWKLGTNWGTVSADGQKMSGKGKSVGAYTWSFNKK